MKRIAIITDSSSGITQKEAFDLGITVLPLMFSIEVNDYEEGVTLSREEFFKHQGEDAKIFTSQPVPEKILTTWDKTLAEYDQILYMPISSDLSGSYQTAAALAEEPEYHGRVLVVDHHRIATPLRRGVLDAIDLVKEGWEIQKIKSALEVERGSVYLAVDTLKYLHQGGRIPAATAVVGTMLNIKPVLKISGPIDLSDKVRGMKQARKKLIENMKAELDATYRDAYEAGELYLMAASSAPEAVTADWVREIRDAFPGMEVLCDDLSLSICCHTGPNALGIGCARKTKII